MSIGILLGLVLVLPIVLTIVLDPRFSVEDATLTRFALATKPTSLSYNLSTVIRVHNPNYYFGIYYDQVQAHFLFEGQRFDWLTLSTFYQHRKKTYKYYPVIGGQSDITLGSTGLNNFMRENQTGLFNLEVRIDAYVRFKPHKNGFMINVVKE
ncbi:NDR1/HIN1-like protein 10 [Ananas comosus]|uniref:NDR1/HIN1-like protein 10 n=1 Tax=Ananas comosus TaxID=4615 RepID=A0A6P5FXF7_ANACO|nr:NDR1/HIN1-like protein 10 [Ananas comosus]